jgi:DNA-binding response OmpR family regulator
VPDVPTKKSVLIVEDDADLRRLYCDVLKANGFALCEAADGPRALRLIEDNPPDVIVLDIMLPTLDGYSVREEIAGNAHTRNIPVIIVTGAEVDVKRLSAARVLKKPIDPFELLRAVRAAIAKVPSRHFGIG